MSVVLALAIALAAIPASPASAVATAPEIEKLVQDGKAGEAIDKGRAAVAARPEDLEVRLALARALAAKGRRLKKVVNLNMTSDDIARGGTTVKGVDLGGGPVDVDYDSSLLDEALQHLDFAIKRAPAREDLRVFQCFLLTDSARIERAKGAIVNALAALPKTQATAKTMTAYGAERAKRGDAEGGAALLAPVVAAFPDNATILVDYANVLTRLGKKSEAYAAFDRVTRLAPTEAGYARTKAIGAMLLRDYKRAQTAFDAAFRLSRGAADQFASYAAAYGLDPKAGGSLMRQLATATATSDAAIVDTAGEFVRAGAAGPASETAMALARKLMTSQQFVFAIPVLDRAIQANPKNAGAKQLLGQAYHELGCPQLAKESRGSEPAGKPKS